MTVKGLSTSSSVRHTLASTLGLQSAETCYLLIPLRQSRSPVRSVIKRRPVLVSRIKWNQFVKYVKNKTCAGMQAANYYRLQQCDA